MEIDRCIGLNFCLWLFEKLRYLILLIECRVLDRRRPADRLACVDAHLWKTYISEKIYAKKPVFRKNVPNVSHLLSSFAFRVINLRKNPTFVSCTKDRVFAKIFRYFR
jgi:hypothetical protein